MEKQMHIAKFSPTLFVLGTACMLGSTCNAASILQEHSGNGGVMSMELSLGFATTTSSAVVSHGPFFAPAILDAPGGPISVQAPGTFTELPASGSAKDIATITPKTTFSYGAPYGTGDDNITFELDARLSAENARDALGDPADASIQYAATFDFFLDPIRVAAGTHVGSLQFDPIAAFTTPYESVKFVIQEFSSGVGWSTLATVSGSIVGPTLVPNIDLYTNRGYSIAYNFSADVPFGIDPHFTTSLGGSFAPALTAVPIPGALLLFGFGAPLLLGFQRSEAKLTS